MNWIMAWSTKLAVRSFDHSEQKANGLRLVRTDLILVAANLDSRAMLEPESTPRR